MKKSLAKKVAAHWNEHFAGSTDATKTIAVAEDTDVYINPTGENVGDAFYHNEEFADMMRTFCISGLVCIREGKIVARFF